MKNKHDRDVENKKIIQLDVKPSPVPMRTIKTIIKTTTQEKCRWALIQKDKAGI